MNIKYSFISHLLVISIGISALFTGCFSPWEGNNALLTIGFGNNSGNRAIEKLSELAHDIDLESPTGQQTIQAERGKTSISVTVASGTWNIRVRAYFENNDSMRELYYEGSATVELKSGRNNPVTIQMRDVRDDNGEIYNFEWILNTNETGIIITKYTGPNGNVVIPSVIEGKPVTAIGEGAFLMREKITGITIPDSVTTIGDLAFAGCFGLTAVTIPRSVNSIGLGSFGNCISLSTISVDPANLNYSSLDGVLYNKDRTVLVAYPENKGSVYTIPNSVTGIGDGAFALNNSLTGVSIPHSVTSIGYMAFHNCNELASITIPNSVYRIGSGAFEECYMLSSVTFDGIMTDLNFLSTDSFFGDLREVYFAAGGGTGTYTRTPGGTEWTKL